MGTGGVIGVWVLSVVPVFLIGLAALLIYGPWAIATSWGSFLVHYGEVSSAFEDGRIIDTIVGLVNIGSLAIPLLGGSLIFALIIRRWSAAAWYWAKAKPFFLRAGLVLGLVTTTSLLLFIWPGADLSEVTPSSLYDWFIWSLGW